MDTIPFNKKKISIADSLYRIAVERLIGKYATVQVRSFRTRGSIKDIVQRDVFGVNSDLYEVENEGTILYESVISPGVEAFVVNLIGFRPDSEVYKNFRRELAEIIGIEDPEILKRRISELPENRYGLDVALDLLDMEPPRSGNCPGT